MNKCTHIILSIYLYFNPDHLKTSCGCHNKIIKHKNRKIKCEYCTADKIKYYNSRHPKNICKNCVLYGDSLDIVLTKSSNLNEIIIV